MSILKLLITSSILFLLVLGLISPDALAQSPFPNARDDNYPLLGLKRAKSTFERAKSDLERAEQLFGKELISRQDYENALNAYADAEVNYQQSMLVLLFEQQFVSIQQALKFQDEQGKKKVRITLANTTNASSELMQVAGQEDEIFRSLQPDVINNIYVSLGNEDGAIISFPYETKIVSLRSGKPESVEFELLQDLDEVVVNIIYGNGSSRSPKVFLQKDASANKVLIQSEQFSQEIELGSSATFGLSLELFSGIDNTYKLEVVNLPRSVSRYFSESAGQARLSQIKFTESSNTRTANLQISLPDRPTDDVPMDEPIDFYVLAIPADKVTAFNENRDESWTEEDLKAFDVGYVRLEMIPRGIGRLVVQAPQLYESVQGRNEIPFTIQLLNEGTRRIDNIEFKVDVPLGWEKRMDPEIISSLNIREEITVRLYVLPPEDISVGRYEVRMKTTGLSENQPVAGEDKVFTVQKVAEANTTSTVIILALILALVATVVYFGVKLSKK